MEAQQLREFFQRCYCINLDRREDRWAEFLGRVKDWPLAPIERFRAIDGNLVPWPHWWTQGAGAWGVYLSTLSILQQCLMDDVKSVLVLEDDCLPLDNFREGLPRFLESVPLDWQQIYLGGQHLFEMQHPPCKVNEFVDRPYNINRLHAYGLSQIGMRIAFSHLCGRNWGPKHHVDHRFGILQMEQGIVAYTPHDWLIGQAAGRSDICGRELPVRFWHRRPQTESERIVVAVLGPYRGGTSAVAGALHHLGIIMGHRFFMGGQAASPKGCFEAKRLYDICLACYPEPSFEVARDYPTRVRLLKEWLQGRSNERRVGAKHPKLCLMIPEMLEAWPSVKFISVHRPLEESVNSLTDLGWWAGTWKPEDLIRRLVETRDRELAELPEDRVYRLDFREFRSNPRTHLEDIAQWAGIKPLEEQYAKACAHIDPSLIHYEKTDG